MMYLNNLKKFKVDISEPRYFFKSQSLTKLQKSTVLPLSLRRKAQSPVFNKYIDCLNLAKHETPIFSDSVSAAVSSNGGQSPN